MKWTSFLTPLLSSFRLQLVIGMVLVVALMMTLFAVEIIREQKDLLIDQKTEQAVSLAQNVATSSSVWVASRDFSGLQNIMTGLRRYPDLEHVIILNNSGQILAHSNPALRGKYLQDFPENAILEILHSDEYQIDVAAPIVLANAHIGWVRLALGQQSLVQRLNEIQLNGFIFTLIAIVLVALFSVIAAGRLTHRLAVIKQVADQIKRGNNRARAGLKGVDEPAQLAQQFDQMLDTLVQRENEVHRSHEALKSSEARLSKVMAITGEGIWDWDIASDDLSINPSWLSIFAIKSNSLKTKAQVYMDMLHPEDKEKVLERLQACLDGTAPFFSEHRMQRADGQIIWVQGRGEVVERDKQGKAKRMIGSIIDFSERKKMEDEIKNLAFFDALTRLPNRRLLMDRLQNAILSSDRSNHFGALMFIDLDNFKTLNDTLGHDKGDQLLTQVAMRLNASVRRSDTVARLGGDEFVVMLTDIGEERHQALMHTEKLAEKLMAELNRDYFLVERQYHSTPSIGITLFKGQQHSVDDLLKQADLAMYQAKSSGRNTLRFYDPLMQTEVNKRAELEADLRRAVNLEQFELHYQKQLDANGVLKGYEALIRWYHPERGMVSPLEFIPVAEENGLILEIGHWVLQEACRQIARWQLDPAKQDLVLAINVSVRQFRHAHFVEEVTQTIHQTQANARQLKFELTESLLVHDTLDIQQKMAKLKTLGVGFALDDFGTGYSSLSYLKRLPFDQLKIDQGFVRDILEDPNDAAIAKAIIALAEALGLSVLAEGVETELQKQALMNMGCFQYQGYLFSRPAPLED
jgi:diguanylate cyclase (GGDEF)-like protein/PAS domain S-box-containing protein